MSHRGRIARGVADSVMTGSEKPLSSARLVASRYSG
jgi:hypothetical protein